MKSFYPNLFLFFLISQVISFQEAKAGWKLFSSNNKGKQASTQTQPTETKNSNPPKEEVINTSNKADLFLIDESQKPNTSNFLNLVKIKTAEVEKLFAEGNYEEVINFGKLIKLHVQSYTGFYIDTANPYTVEDNTFDAIEFKNGVSPLFFAKLFPAKKEKIRNIFKTKVISGNFLELLHLYKVASLLVIQSEVLLKDQLKSDIEKSELIERSLQGLVELADTPFLFRLNNIKDKRFNFIALLESDIQDPKLISELEYEIEVFATKELSKFSKDFNLSNLIENYRSSVLDLVVKNFLQPNQDKNLTKLNCVQDLLLTYNCYFKSADLSAYELNTKTQSEKLISIYYDQPKWIRDNYTDISSYMKTYKEHISDYKAPNVSIRIPFDLKQAIKTCSTGNIAYVSCVREMIAITNYSRWISDGFAPKKYDISGKFCTIDRSSLIDNAKGGYYNKYPLPTLSDLGLDKINNVPELGFTVEQAEVFCSRHL